MTQKALILAVETSGRIGSVAIALGEQILGQTAFSAPMRHSSEIFTAITALLSRFSRKPTEIGHIYISIGPGSFTGLRIAVTMAKIMHLANAAKIVAVDTLDVIAANAINLTTQNCQPKTTSHEPRVTKHERIAVILDAKRSQFFIAAYQRYPRQTVLSFLRKQESISHCPLSAVRCPLLKILPDSLMTAPQFLEKFANREKPISLLGEGLLYYKDKFKAQGIKFLDEQYWNPSAEKVHLLGCKLAQAGKFADPLTLTPNYLRRPDLKQKTN